MVGPVVPVPVPQFILDSLRSVEVTTAAGARSGFQLTFSLSANSPLHTLFLLSGGSIQPVIRVIIVATLNGTPEVLMDGVITHHQVSPGDATGQATLTITGEDLTAMMDLIDFSGIPYPAMPFEVRVALIIAKYAVFGMIPLVIPTVLVDVPIPIQSIPRHQGTDLAYINLLAEEAGYIFYLKPGPAPGTNIAYWGPEIKVGIPQPALTTNMDMHTNVESLDFSFDTQAKTQPILFIQDRTTKVPIPIPVPDISLLNPPLGLIPAIPQKFAPVTDAAKLSPARAALRGLAKSAKTSDTVSGKGSLDVLRYGRPLRARELVGVRGVGLAFDGLYFVKSVKHIIKRTASGASGGEYKQSFTLSRNGLLSTLPNVPV